MTILQQKVSRWRSDSVRSEGVSGASTASSGAAGSIVVAGVILALSLTLEFDHTDFQQFWTTAQLIADGRAAYPAFVAPNGHTIYNLNPPHFHLPLLLLLPLGQSVARRLWVTLGIVCLLYSERRVGVLRRRPGPLALFALSVNAITLSVLSTDAPVWLLSPVVVAAWQCDREGRHRAAGALLGLLLSLKLFFLAFVPWLLWRRQYRQISWVILGAIAPFAIGIAVCGLAPYAEWVGALNTTAGTADLRLNMSLNGVLARAGRATPLWQAAVLAPTALIAILRLRGASVDKGWAILLPSLLLCSPVGWTYYASWLWPIWARWRGTTLEWLAIALWLVPPQFVVSNNWLLGSPYAIGLFLLFLAQLGSARDTWPDAIRAEASGSDDRTGVSGLPK